MKKCYTLFQIDEIGHGGAILCGVFTTKKRGMEAFESLKETSPVNDVTKMILLEVNLNLIMDDETTVSEIAHFDYNRDSTNMVLLNNSVMMIKKRTK